METAPHQLFDGSFYEALVNTQLRTPPNVAPLHNGRVEPRRASGASSVTPTPTETESGETESWEDFDWEAYTQRFYEQLPEDCKKDEDSRAFARSASIRVFLARQLETNVVSYLLRATPPKSVWAFVTNDIHRDLLPTISRGFQRQPSVLKQPVVRARMIKWLELNPAHTFILLALWAEQPTVPSVLAAVKKDCDLAALQERIPALVKTHSLEAVLAALAWAPLPRHFLALNQQLEDAEAFNELVQAATEETEQPCAETENAGSGSPEQQLEYWKNQAAHWEQQALQGRVALAEVLDRAEHMQAQLDRQARESDERKRKERQQQTQWEKKLAHAEAKNRGEIERLGHDYERAARKLKATEKERAELELELRRLKKQLRQSLQLLEEERKKPSLAEPAAGTEEGGPLNTSGNVEAVSTPEATPATSTRPVVVAPPTPLDELFEWRADGRMVRLTPRAVKRLVDANDEDAVFTIMQALDGMPERDKPMREKFLQKLASAGSYYSRVLTHATTRVLVDASNVARYSPNRYGKGRLRYLLSMREELRQRDCFPITFYADASLPYFIDEPKELRAMIHRGEILMVDKGTEADELLAREARRTGAYVVTNDRLFFNKVSPDFEPPRITFRIYDGTVIVDDF